MNFAAQMRVGSLEILAALALFAIVSSRLRAGGLRTSKGPAAVQLSLAVHDAPAGAPREVAFELRQGEEPAILGRSSQAEVGLLDPEVSRRHARLDLLDGVIYLTDLDSSNGTFLNGKAVGDEGIELKAGDDIDVGNTRIRVIGTQPLSWT